VLAGIDPQFTMTSEITFNDHLLTRLEYRRDWSTASVFPQGRGEGSLRCCRISPRLLRSRNEFSYGDKRPFEDVALWKGVLAGPKSPRPEVFSTTALVKTTDQSMGIPSETSFGKVKL
jgi:hypothetical protein